MFSRAQRWHALILAVLLLFPLIAEAISFSNGDQLQVHSSNLQSPSVEMARIDGSRMLLYYAANDEGYLAVATRDGMNVSKGADHEIGPVVARGAVTMLTDTKGVLTYVDEDDGRAGKAVVVTVSGDTVTFGTPITFENAVSNDSNQGLAIDTLDSTHFAVVYATLEVGTDMFGDPENTNSGALIIGSVSGTDITFGSAAIYSRDKVGAHDIAALDSTHVVVTYGTTAGTSAAVIGSVSGTSITLGTPAQFATGGDYFQNDALDSSHFIVAYQGGGPGKARIGVVSGTTITYGTEYEFSSETSNAISVAAINDTTAAIVYNDFGGGTYGTVTIATVSGNSVTAGDSSVFGISMNASTALNLDSETLAVGYYNNNDSKGYIRIAYRDLPDPEVSSSSSSSGNTERTPPSGGGRRGTPGRGGTAVALTNRNISHAAAASAVSDSSDNESSFVKRTCERVMNWFRGDAKMLARVNERVQKRFGFVCGAN